MLFKAKDKKLLSDKQELLTAADAVGALKLKKFQKFDSAVTALDQAAALSESKASPMLAQFLEALKDETKASLAVADSSTF